MADNFTTAPGTGGETFASDDIGGVQFPRFKLTIGADGVNGGDVSPSNPMPTTALTDAQLRALPVAISGALTDAQLRATAVPVSLASTAVTNTVAVSGPLTDAQLRATAVPVSAASLPLPSGAATETTLAAMNAKLPGQGQQTMANSQPVVIASNQSAIPTVEAALLLTGQAAQTAVVNNILEAVAGASGTDVSNYRSASVQVVSTGTAGTFIFEQSNDGTNWIALPVFNSALATAVPIVAAITATASAIIYTIPLRCRFLRLRIATLITGGSIQAFSRLSTEPWTPTVASIAQGTAANLNATVSGTVTANIGTGALAAGTNAIGDVGVQYRANATGAASITNLVAAASANPTVVKASAGRLLGFVLTNNATAVRYVKFHNQATSPTAGAGVVATFGIPPNGGTAYMEFPGGIGFATGIALTTVTGAAATDATAVAANDIAGTVVWA